MATDLPPHDVLADADDELGWDTGDHGPMVDAATDGIDEPATAPLTPDEAVRVLLDSTEG